MVKLIHSDDHKQLPGCFSSRFTELRSARCDQTWLVTDTYRNYVPNFISS